MSGLLADERHLPLVVAHKRQFCRSGAGCLRCCFAARDAAEDVSLGEVHERIIREDDVIRAPVIADENEVPPNARLVKNVPSIELLTRHWKQRIPDECCPLRCGAAILHMFCPGCAVARLVLFLCLHFGMAASRHLAVFVVTFLGGSAVPFGKKKKKFPIWGPSQAIT